MLRVNAVVLALLTLGMTGCRTFADYPSPPSPDADGDVSSDGRLSEGRLDGPLDLADVLTGDAATTDAAAADARVQDTRAMDTGGFCSGPLPQAVFARYRFDTIDMTASPPMVTVEKNPPKIDVKPGELVDSTTGSAPKMEVVLGYTGCSQALQFNQRDATAITEGTFAHMIIPSSTTFYALKKGSISLLVRFDRPAGTFEGILSRDANQQKQGGHVSLYRLSDGRLAVRLQGRSTGESVACTQIKPTKGSWHEVVISFGKGGTLSTPILSTTSRSISTVCRG